MKPERAALLITTAVAIGCVASELFHVEPRPDPAATQRTDQLILALQDSGWVVLTAEEHGNLQWQLTDLEADTSRLSAQVREYARQVELAGAEARALTEFRAEAEAALELSAAAHGDTLLRLERGYAGLRTTPDSITAAFDDGVFSGRVAYRPGPGRFSLLVRAQIEAALAITEAADGRVLFSAIPADPRVSIRLDRGLYQRPEPVRVCTLGQRARTSAGAIAGWESMKLLVRSLR